MSVLNFIFYKSDPNLWNSTAQDFLTNPPWRVGRKKYELCLGIRLCFAI
jgi:hypothetical protein